MRTSPHTRTRTQSKAKRTSDRIAGGFENANVSCVVTILVRKVIGRNSSQEEGRPVCLVVVDDVAYLFLCMFVCKPVQVARSCIPRFYFILLDKLCFREGIASSMHPSHLGVNLLWISARVPDSPLSMEHPNCIR